MTHRDPGALSRLPGPLGAGDRKEGRAAHFSRHIGGRREGEAVSTRCPRAQTLLRGGGATGRTSGTGDKGAGLAAVLGKGPGARGCPGQNTGTESRKAPDLNPNFRDRNTGVRGASAPSHRASLSRLQKFVPGLVPAERGSLGGEGSSWILRQRAWDAEVTVLHRPMSLQTASHRQPGTP